MSILSRNKFFAGRRLPESRKCGGLRAAVFFCYGLPRDGNVCRGTKCRLRGDMPGSARAGRFVRLPFFCYGLPKEKMLSKGETLVICRAVCLAGRSVRLPVGLVAGLFGRRFSAAGFLVAGSYGCRFVRGVFFVGAVGRFLGLLVFRGDFPVGGCGNVSNA